MPAKYTALNLKDKTIDELKSLKLLLDCKTYDGVIAALVEKAGYREALDNIARIRSEFPDMVQKAVSKTVKDVEDVAELNGTSIAEEAKNLQKRISRNSK